MPTQLSKPITRRIGNLIVRLDASGVMIRGYRHRTWRGLSFARILADDLDQQLANAVADCKARPTIAKPREVKITLRVKPHLDDPDDVLIEPVTTTKTPARQLDPIRARRAIRNQLQFDFEE